MARGVYAEPLAVAPGPARGIEKLGRALRVVTVARGRLGMNPVERMDEGIGDRLTSIEELLVELRAVEREDQRSSDPPVLEQRVFQVEVDMFIDQAGLEQDVETLAVAFLEDYGVCG